MCHTGVGCVIQELDGSYRGGVCHTGVGVSYKSGVCHTEVGCIIQG